MVLDKALALGETFWDTADVYFDNEDLLRNWFKRTGKRSEIFLATKFANTHEKDAGGRYIIRSGAAYVKESCEKSLQRLGVDCIDLYYCSTYSQNDHYPFLYPSLKNPEQILDSIKRRALRLCC